MPLSLENFQILYPKMTNKISSPLRLKTLRKKFYKKKSLCLCDKIFLLVLRHSLQRGGLATPKAGNEGLFQTTYILFKFLIEINIFKIN